jgi:hypothetical protein
MIWLRFPSLRGRLLLSQQSWSAGTRFGTRPDAFRSSQGSTALIKYLMLASPEVVRRLRLLGVFPYVQGFEDNGSHACS